MVLLAIYYLESCLLLLGFLFGERNKKNEKICQLVNKNKELEEEIERLNKVNQEFARDYWDRINKISSYPLVTSGNWRYF